MQPMRPEVESARCQHRHKILQLSVTALVFTRVQALLAHRGSHPGTTQDCDVAFTPINCSTAERRKKNYVKSFIRSQLAAERAGFGHVHTTNLPAKHLHNDLFTGTVITATAPLGARTHPAIPTTQIRMFYSQQPNARRCIWRGIGNGSRPSPDLPSGSSTQLLRHN